MRDPWRTWLTIIAVWVAIFGPYLMIDSIRAGAGSGRQEMPAPP